MSSFLFVTIESNKSADDVGKSPTFDHGVFYTTYSLAPKGLCRSLTFTIERRWWYRLFTTYHLVVPWKGSVTIWQKKTRVWWAGNSLLGSVILWESNQKYIRQMKRNDWRLDRKYNLQHWKSDESLNHHSASLNRKCGNLKLMENFHNNAGWIKYLANAFRV